MTCKYQQSAKWGRIVTKCEIRQYVQQCYLTQSSAQESVDGIADHVVEEDDDLDDGEEDVDCQPAGASSPFRHH